MYEGAGLTPEAVKELRKTTDLALRATKHTVCAVGCPVAGLVASERHLWLNLTEIREKVFLLDAPISQTGLFGEAVSLVVANFALLNNRRQLLNSSCPGGWGTPPALPPLPWQKSAPYLGRIPPAEAAPWLIPPKYGLGRLRPTFFPPTTSQPGRPVATRHACHFSSSESSLTFKPGWGERLQTQEARPDRSNLSARLQLALLTQVCHTHPVGFGVQKETISPFQCGSREMHQAFSPYHTFLRDQRPAR